MDENTYIDDYINAGYNDIISLKNFYDTILIGNSEDDTHIFRVAIGDFFLNHYQELESIIEVYTCPEQYFYNPKMLSNDLYGTTELWLAILRANDMKNITEFHLPVVRIYNPDALLDIIQVYFKREGKM